MMLSVTKVIGNYPHFLQLERNLMYLKDKDRREKILTNGLEINNVTIFFHETNLYSSGNQTKKT